MGLIVPQVRIHDQVGLAPHEYRVKIRGTVVGQGVAHAGRLLAVPPAGLVTRPDGRDGVDPVTGQPAVWIHADGRELAELAGCRVLETAAVIAGHFGEIVASHADEILTREQVERLLDRVRSSAPTLANEVVPGLLRAGELQRVLQNLLRERVGIRDLETILETLAVHAGKTKDIDVLTEQVRRSLARQITEKYRGPDGRLRVAALSARLDDRLAAASQGELRPAESLGEETARGIVHAVAEAVSTLIEGGYPPVILTTAAGSGGAQGFDAGGPAATGRAEPARDSAGYADRNSRESGRGRAAGADDLHDDGGTRMNDSPPVGASFYRAERPS